jgi:hypothetical protein
VLALVLAGALLVCVVPANNFVNRGILGAHNARAEKQLIIFDIAGMSNYTGKNLFATHPLWPVDRLPPPIPCYTPKRWNPYYFLGACRGYEAAFDEVSERSRSSLIDWWFGQVIRHPVAYLRHRFAYSHKLIRTQQHIIFPKPPYSDTLNSKLDPRYGNPAYNAEIREEGRPGAAHISLWPNTLAEEPFAKLSSLIFSRQNAYILSVLVCFGLWAWGLRRHFMGREVDPIAILAAAMGLGNFGMLIFFGVASEGRYLLPTICCACFAALTAARALTREPRTQAPAA